MKTNLYFDYASATPADPRVVKAMLPYFSELFFNPSAGYLPAQKVKADMNRARAKVASWLGAKPAEIIFTAGATEANNLAIRGVMEAFPKAKLLVGEIEHESILAPSNMFKRGLVAVDEIGKIKLEDLRQKIDDQVVLVSIMYANNEMGTIEPIRDIALLIEDVRADRRQRSITLPIYFHTDAAQAANYLDLHVARLDVDIMSLNGEKIYGPKQSGILYVRAGTKINPLILGGGQEMGMRGGTENVAANIGFAEALELAQKSRKAESLRQSKLRDLFINQMSKNFSAFHLNGPIKNRLPNNANFYIEGFDNEKLLFQLEQAGIMASAGSVCAVASDEPSHVLKAMGISTPNIRSTIRFSFGRATNENSINSAIKIFKRLLE